MTLQSDVARCGGKWIDAQPDFECRDCRRREPVHPAAWRTVMIAPPRESPCPSRIPQEIKR